MKLNLVTFNIRCCDDGPGLMISDRAPRLGAIIDKYDPDVMGLQECTPAWTDYIEKNLLDRYDFFLKYRGENSLEGTPILWKKDKFDCIDRGYFWLSDTPEKESVSFDGQYLRICMYVVLREKESGREFTYFNTHVGFGDECHVKSADLLYEKYLALGGGSAVISADFNMYPDGAGYARMTEHFTDANTDLTSPTYHNYDRGGSPGHIDYCFITDGIKSERALLIDDKPGGNFPSDHYGLLFTLSM